MSAVIESSHVQGRRELHFTSWEQVFADAEILVSSPRTKAIGNWSLSQLLMHLALVVNRSIDGIPFKAPWFHRLIARFLRGRILKKGMEPGFKLPREREAGAFPSAASPRDALETLRKAVARLQTERMSASHPAFGKLTHEEWLQLHLRHAELHLSFVLPG